MFCFSHTADDLRPEQAIATSGLTLVRRQAVYFRATRPPGIALFTCAWRGAREEPAPLVIRDQHGRWTAEYLSMREEMGASSAFLQRARANERHHNQVERPLEAIVDHVTMERAMLQVHRHHGSHRSD
jgi:hypothetical protein